MPIRGSLPVLPDDNPQVSILLKNLADSAGNEDGDLQDFLFERKIDGEQENVFIKKIAGYAALGDDAGNYETLGGGHYYSTSGTKERFTVFNGGANSDIYKLVTATWTAQSRSLTKDVTAEFCQFDNSLYVTNQTDAVQKYNGSAWSTLATGTPLSGSNNIAKYLVEYRKMLIAANTVNNPQRLYVSDVGTPETFGASNYWDFPGAITGVAVLGTMLVVFTKNTTSVMQGYSPSTLVTTSNPKVVRYGCLSHRTIKEAETTVGKCLIFLSNDTVRAFNGEQVFRVGYDYLANQWSNINNAQYSKACAAVYDNRYWLSVPWAASTTNNKVLCYDLRYDRWVRINNWQASYFDVYDNGTEVLNFGESSADSRVWQYPSGYTTQKPSASTAITERYTTKNIDGNAPNLIKKFKKLYLQIKAIGSTTLLVESNVDEYGYQGLRFGSAGTSTTDLTPVGPLWGTAIWGAFTWGTTTLVRTPNNRGILSNRGKLIKIKITDSQTTGQSEVYFMELFYIPKKVR